MCVSTKLPCHGSNWDAHVLDHLNCPWGLIHPTPIRWPWPMALQVCKSVTVLLQAKGTQFYGLLCAKRCQRWTKFFDKRLVAEFPLHRMYTSVPFIQRTICKPKLTALTACLQMKTPNSLVHMQIWSMNLWLCIVESCHAFSQDNL